MFVYSNVDAHKSFKKHHWFGGKNWQHPFLLREGRKEDKAGDVQFTGVQEPLKIHPGVQVNPAGTSQVCSKCERNPISILRENYRDNDKLEIKEGGLCEIAGDYQLLIKRKFEQGASSESVRRAQRESRRRKEVSRYSYPASTKTISAKDLERMIRRQMRQPQLSARSRDTSQSWYSCVFVDCQHEMHADENAAINIVTKWFNSMRISQDAGGD